MTTRGQHCSAEKLGLRFQELALPSRGEGSKTSPWPSARLKDVDDGSEGGDYSRGFHNGRNLSPQSLLLTHGKFCEITLWGPSCPFYRGEK